MTSAPITDTRVPARSAAGVVPEGVPSIVMRRLAPARPDDAVFSWVATAIVVLIGAVLRLVGLSHPPGKIFDEVYYATQGDDLFHHGVEWNTTTDSGDFVVHPPLGKWLIGAGEALFRHPRPLGAAWELTVIVAIAALAAGLSLVTRRRGLWASLGGIAVILFPLTCWAVGRTEPLTFGWRIMPAVFGTLAILILIRVTRRLLRSTVLGVVAGLLLALDGMEFVLSRTALLDIFLLFFVLAAFACLVMDRDQRRRRWLRALETGLDPTRTGRPPLTFPAGVPWWRLTAAVMTGCAMSVKWSAIWYAILFVILIVVWEAGARRSAGVPRPWRDTMLGETGWIVAFGLVFVATYLAAWSGWFATDHGWDRHWLRDNGRGEPFIIGALRNLWHYHLDALRFHDSLTAWHKYQSWPWQWLLLGRPVAFYYCGTAGCASGYSAEVLLLGTPLLWWSFLPALLGTGAYGVARRDWRAVAVFLAACAGIATWFPWEFDHRTMFYFYCAPAVPFLIMAVVYVLGAMVKEPPGARVWGIERRALTSVILGGYLLVVAWCFLYFYPLYTGETITFTDWFAHMWLGGRWI